MYTKTAGKHEQMIQKTKRYETGTCEMEKESKRYRSHYHYMEETRLL